MNLVDLSNQELKNIKAGSDDQGSACPSCSASCSGTLQWDYAGTNLGDAAANLNGGGIGIIIREYVATVVNL